ncbi:quinolinate synthetase [Thermovibrio guaymasensis]|uniref:Quinolinate synthase n=1 Tax=Thermovibrio guaymasensis TaxID=240167 RepID=A0A420W724_9BACT|nr:quinolinate synthase NadA [Thermovibrio guaymasensis]RKQ61860.1 quinolinate synthetase [Thermovibrio guaymasensis]
MEREVFIDRVSELKKEKKAVILAHYYVDGLIQDVADFVGDSLELARKAKEVDGEIILFCGVYFMAETAKVLNPDRKVLIPYYKAGCLMADMAIAEELKEFRENNPDYTVVTYVNSSAGVKALSDVCCTSANAVKIVESLEGDKILFVPDRNLGSFVAEKIKGKEVKLWEGYCPVHQKLNPEQARRVKEENPDAVFVVHPECRKEVRDIADFVGSTSQIVKFVKGTDAKKVIVGTEMGTIHQLKKLRPDVEFIPAYPDFICDQMKMITPERVLRALEREQFEVSVPEEVAEGARRAIERMLERS